MTTHSKRCPVCNIDFHTSDSRKTYCTRSCAAKYNNSAFPKRKKIQNERKCEFCGDLTRRSDRKFCSKECAYKKRAAERAVEKANIISSGANLSDRNGELLGWVRSFLLEEAENKCPKCGWSVPNPVLGRPILTINHIDGNWQNNRLDNLEVLCYNCHTLTPDFGSLNKGNPLVSTTRRNSGRVGI